MPFIMAPVVMKPVNPGMFCGFALSTRIAAPSAGATTLMATIAAAAVRASVLFSPVIIDESPSGAPG